VHEQRRLTQQRFVAGKTQRNGGVSFNLAHHVGVLRGEEPAVTVVVHVTVVAHWTTRDLSIRVGLQQGEINASHFLGQFGQGELGHGVVLLRMESQRLRGAVTEAWMSSCGLFTENEIGRMARV
jgi:hypothetical protein